MKKLTVCNLAFSGPRIAVDVLLKALGIAANPAPATDLSLIVFERGEEPTGIPAKSYNLVREIDGRTELIDRGHVQQLKVDSQAAGRCHFLGQTALAHHYEFTCAE